jgi:hypothetical protein
LRLEAARTGRQDACPTLYPFQSHYEVIAEAVLAQLVIIHAAIFLVQIAFQHFHQTADGVIECLGFGFGLWLGPLLHGFLLSENDARYKIFIPLRRKNLGNARRIFCDPAPEKTIAFIRWRHLGRYLIALQIVK